MSGGRKINDHSFWAGGKSKESVFPMSAKMKQESSAEGAGHLSSYEDTTEMVKSSQELADRQAKKYDRKPLHRN